jgi:hypothetical protein
VHAFSLPGARDWGCRMPRMVRKNLAAGLALTIGALLAVAGVGAAPQAVAATGPAALTDAVGDTIDRNTNDKLPSARTDIVGATVESGAQGIVLSFKTQEMADPATDPSWASLNTFVSWQVDSSGDGKVDDLIRYSVDRDSPGVLIGEVTHWSGPGQPAKHCDAQATFNPATGYSLTIAPACMNNPTAISYRVQLTYDTDPKLPKPPLAFDVLPDTGLAGPVSIAVPTAPAAAPPAPGGAPAPPAGENPAPGQAAPPVTGAPSPSKPAGGPAAKAAPKPTAPARTPASTAAPKPAAPAPAAAPTGPTTGELAATGPSMARWLGALGGALMLLGGLGLMTPADRRRRSTV